MGDSELSPVDFDSLSKSMSFYSPERPMKDFRSPTTQQLDNSIAGGSADNSMVKQLYTSDLHENPEQMEKTTSPPLVEKRPPTENGEIRSELQNGLHRVKENGTQGDVADVDALMTSLCQMGFAGVSGNQGSNLWDDKTLSSAMCQMLQQTGMSGVANQRAITAHHQQPSNGQQIFGNQQMHVQQGNWFLNASQPGQLAWNGTSPSPQGNWSRQGFPRQSNHRLMTSYSPSGAHMLPQGRPVSVDSSSLMSSYRHNSPFPTLLQHVPNRKSSADVRCSENGSNSTILGLHQDQTSRYDALRYANSDASYDAIRTTETNDLLNGTARSVNLSHLDCLQNSSSAEKFLRRDKSPFGMLSSLDGSLMLDQIVPSLPSPTTLSQLSPGLQLGQQRMEHFSRKVFVGGLPPDIDEDEITAAFRRFGHLVVDWPHKAESKSYFPPKGYCFLLFQDELSVMVLTDSCLQDEGKLYWCVSSPTMKDKPVQIRPWNLADSDYVMDGTQPLDPRKTIFVGGVPRPLRAAELAMIMDRLYGGVCYAGIDTDPDLRYPKGAGRVAFSNQQSYIAAISARFVQLQHADIDKRVEVKPYVLDDQLCDECQGVRCGGKFAPFFCANVTCLQYYCEQCWTQIHSRPGREFHKPLVKEGADRPRSMPFRWC